MKIFCFSGSGNSYSVAAEIGKHFSIKPELITSFKDKNKVEVTDLQIGIVAPVYLNDIPKVVKEFILKLSFADMKAYVFTVLTSSSGKNKSGFKNISIALSKHTVKLALAYDLSMPSSFKVRTGMDSVLGAIPQKIKGIINAIENKRVNYAPKGSVVLSKNFTKLPFLTKPLARMNVTEKCNGCGLCCKLCPTSNIELQNGKAMRNKNCIACTACANWCPQQAIKSRWLKGQYRHPEVSANDLIASNKIQSEVKK